MCTGNSRWKMGLQQRQQKSPVLQQLELAGEQQQLELAGEQQQLELAGEQQQLGRRVQTAWAVIEWWYLKCRKLQRWH